MTVFLAEVRIRFVYPAAFEREGEQRWPVYRPRRRHAGSGKLGLHQLEPGTPVLGHVAALPIGRRLEQQCEMLVARRGSAGLAEQVDRDGAVESTRVEHLEAVRVHVHLDLTATPKRRVVAMHERVAHGLPHCGLRVVGDVAAQGPIENPAHAHVAAHGGDCVQEHGGDGACHALRVDVLHSELAGLLLAWVAREGHVEPGEVLLRVPPEREEAGERRMRRTVLTGPDDAEIRHGVLVGEAREHARVKCPLP